MEAPTTYSIRLERRIAAPPEAVFRAWTDAKTIVRWFAPHVAGGCVAHAVEPRAGGAMHLDMHSPDGKLHELRCTFVEVRPNERIVLRWSWASNPAAGESLVTVTLKTDGAGTLLVLVHEGFTTLPAREAHEQGWIGCLDRLSATY